MGKRWEEETDTFVAEDDAGYTHYGVKYTMFENTSAFGNPNRISELKSRYIIDGVMAQEVGEDEFEIVESGLRVKRIS